MEELLDSGIHSRSKRITWDLSLLTESKQLPAQLTLNSFSHIWTEYLTFSIQKIDREEQLYGTDLEIEKIMSFRIMAITYHDQSCPNSVSYTHLTLPTIYSV